MVSLSTYSSLGYEGFQKLPSLSDPAFPPSGGGGGSPFSELEKGLSGPLSCTPTKSPALLIGRLVEVLGKTGPFHSARRSAAARGVTQSEATGATRAALGRGQC